MQSLSRTQLVVNKKRTRVCKQWLRGRSDKYRLLQRWNSILECASVWCGKVLLRLHRNTDTQFVERDRDLGTIHSILPLGVEISQFYFCPVCVHLLERKGTAAG